MAENRAGAIPEPELRTVRDVLYRQRATDLDSLQKQVKSMGAALMDALVKSIGALEGALQDTRGHLKVAVETLMEQSVEVETLKLKVEKGAGSAAAPGTGQPAVDALLQRVARLEERLAASERSLGAAEQAAGALRETAGRIGDGDGPPAGDLVARLADHLYLLSRMSARRSARERVEHARALARMADSLARGFVPRVVALRQDVGGDVAAYDGLRGLEARGLEACEDLRREAQRLAEAAAADAAALNGAPDDVAGKLDSCRDLLALGAVGETGDDLGFEVRRAVSQWFLPLVDLTAEYREATAGAAQEAFAKALVELDAAGRHLDLEMIAPAPGASFDPAAHEPEGAAPDGPAHVARLLAPGCRIDGAILRRARVAVG